MAVTKIDTEICLFDLDGTLVNSTKAVEAAWKEMFLVEDINPEGFFEDNHGVRTVDVFKKYLPHLDDSGNILSDKFEVGVSSNHGHLASPIKGSPELIKLLPNDRWCIVTSGTPALAHGWFEKVLLAAGFYKPSVFITSVDVSSGKPHPEGYSKGATLLSKGDRVFTKKVVFEDAPAGIQAGLASGAVVVGIASSFDKDTLVEAGATYVVPDLSHVKVLDKREDGFTLEIDAL